MQIINYNNNKATLLYFDTLSSMANVQVHKKNMDAWLESSRERKYAEEWYGVPSLERVREIVEQIGWEEGVKKGLESVGELMAPKLPTYRRKRTNSSYGHSVNVAKLLVGNINKAWRSSKKIQTNSKLARKGLVNIIIDHTASAGVSSEDFFWRGAVGVLLAKAVQASGRKVRLLSGFAVREFTWENAPGSKYMVCMLEVKKYGQPIEFNSMFSVTALAGFFRYYGFKAILSMPFKIESGLGRAANLQVETLDYILDDSPCIVVENIWNAKTAKLRALELVEELEK